MKEPSTPSGPITFKQGGGVAPSLFWLMSSPPGQAAAEYVSTTELVGTLRSVIREIPRIVAANPVEAGVALLALLLFAWALIRIT